MSKNKTFQENIFTHYLPAKEFADKNGISPSTLANSKHRFGVLKISEWNMEVYKIPAKGENKIDIPIKEILSSTPADAMGLFQAIFNATIEENSELKTENSKIEPLELQVSDLTERLEAKRQENEGLQLSVDDLTEQLERTNNELRNVIDIQNNLLTANNQLEAEVNRQNGIIQEVKAVNEEKEKTISMLQEELKTGGGISTEKFETLVKMFETLKDEVSFIKNRIK